MAMLPVGGPCFYQAHFGRTVLPKRPFWAHLFCSVFYSASELRRACFREACVAQPVLPPGALFHTVAFALLHCAPKSHMCPLPHLGFSDHRPVAFVAFIVTNWVLPEDYCKKDPCSFNMECWCQKLATHVQPLVNF